MYDVLVWGDNFYILIYLKNSQFRVEIRIIWLKYP